MAYYHVDDVVEGSALEILPLDLTAVSITKTRTGFVLKTAKRETAFKVVATDKSSEQARVADARAPAMARPCRPGVRR